MTRQQLGETLRHLRQSKNLTLEQVSERLEISYQYLGQIERGVNLLPIKICKKLSRLYAVELDYLIDLMGDVYKSELKIRLRKGG